MGSYQSQFQRKPEQNLNLDPKKIDWITGHADATGLAVVEVQRYWYRFKQLGCDKYGYLSAASLEKSELGNDVIVKNILLELPKEKNGSLSFVVFLNFLHWCELSDTNSKLKAIFNFLNDGNELNSTVFTKLWKRLFPNYSQSEIAESVEMLMSQLDPKNTGRITETQFVNNLKRNYSEYQLNDILNFDLIPSELLEETNMQPSLSGSMINMKNDKNYPLVIELSDKILEDVARKAIYKDWEKFSIKLGFLEYDIKSYKTKHRGDSFETMYDILLQWRDQDPYLATKSRLRRYLEDSDMNDAAAILR